MMSAISNFLGPRIGYVALLIGALTIAARATYFKTFIDESEAATSNIANEKRGIKPTKVTRALYIILMLGVCGFAIWKMVKL
jgi:hypothetical protein